jgi:hypothetical protein
MKCFFLYVNVIIVNDRVSVFFGGFLFLVFFFFGFFLCRQSHSEH